MAEVREAEYRFGTMCGELDDKWPTIIEGMAAIREARYGLSL